MGEEKDPLLGITDPEELEEALAKLKIEDLEELARATPADTFGDRRVFDDFDDDNNNVVDDDSFEPIEDIEPANPWDEGETEDFTEEELINVLRSFEEADEATNADDIVEFPSGDVLPELEFLEGDNSALLPPAEFTASIFDAPVDSEENRNNDDDSDSDSVTKTIEHNGTNTTIATEALDDEKKGDLDDGGGDDDDDLGLLEGLQKLNLDWQTDEENDIDFHTDNGDDIPPYFYCQPCTPVGKTNATSFSLASIAEDEALVDPSVVAADLQQFEKEGRPKLPQKEFDYLLQLLSEKEMDSLFEKAASEAQQEAHNNNNSNQENSTTQEFPASPKPAPEPSQPVTINVSRRPEALDAAAPILASFVSNASGLENERSCLGHKETIFGTSFSECGKYLASASQDSTVRVWDVASNAALATLQEHSTDYECLRVAWASSEWASDTLDRGNDSTFSSLLATAGADGTAKIWASKDPSQKGSWSCCATLDHADLDRVPFNPEDEKERPQIYALQWINHWSGLPVASEKATRNSFLLTSSDDFIHLWELETKKDNVENLTFREVMSLHFTTFHNHGYGVSICQVTDSGLGMRNDSKGGTTKVSTDMAAQKPFGGDRNPNNMIFVFDADYCPANGLLGVALSDGTLRLINGRGVCISIVALPGCQSHLTSFSWDTTGTRLATCVATGHVVLWGINVHEGQGSLTTTCSSVLEGGHELGRPVFGSIFFGAGENLLLTWGVDGRLCLWDSFSSGNIHAPIATLVANASYPIYAVDVRKSSIAVCGGGGEQSFLGTPVLIYDTKTEK